MSLQKYRADKADPPCENGSVAWRTEWQFGPSLAKVEQCPIRDEFSLLKMYRTVYVIGEPELFFCHPAVCQIRNKIVRGSLYRDDEGYYFQPYIRP